MPDVVNMYDVATDYDNATPQQKQQAAIDLAGMAPLPGGKLLAEGFEHGLDALGTAGRHSDDIPTGVVDDVASGAAHSVPDAPSVPHVDPVPTNQLPTPDVFNPNQGLHYASGDPYHPGGWPPSTPEATWTKGDNTPGWEHVNRGTEKPWMDYQAQISGIERTPDGRIPEWVIPDPETGTVVKFDSPPIDRGDHQVILDAKHDYTPLIKDPDGNWTGGMRNKLVDEAMRQLDVLPPGTGLEWHVANPQSAAAIRELLANRGVFDVTVIYTPQKP